MARQKELQDEQLYDMSSDTKGLVLIINNFSEHRIGSIDDVELMKNMWINLQFLPYSHQDLNVEEMDEKLKQFCKKRRLKEADSLVVVLMSHGNEKGILGYCEDGQQIYQYKRLFEKFNEVNCPAMKGKPKLIFIQACRGTSRDGISVDLPSPPTAIEEIDPDFTQFALKDTYIIYSTCKGNFSLRENSGTIFIKAINEVFLKYADKCDFVDLMTKVKNKVSNEIRRFHGRYIMQQPILDGFLPKKLYLKKQDSQQN